MDEQIKPVAWVDTDDLEYLVADGEVCADLHNSRVGECFAPLYSQQSIDTLREEVDRLRGSLADSDAEIEFAYARAERAEAEAEALRAQLRGIQQDALELYEQIPQLPVTIHTLDAATDAFTRFCIDFSEHIDAARKGAE